ncbi:unnamed protein product [Ectocarpus sp. CCAP 1310/34]|nr:unnamed protein product [Ectocarpus sp. CCAP 1310/34]
MVPVALRAAAAAILLGRESRAFVRSSASLRVAARNSSVFKMSSAQARPPAAAADVATTAGGTLLAHGDFMSKCDLVLASQSPRRLEIVGMMGLADRVRVVVSEFEENLDKSSFKDPRDYAIANAEGKAREVASRALRNEEGEGAEPIVVVGSDTIVDLDGVILEKPRDDEHAFSMLSSLSGRRHLVHSGVSIFTSKLGKDKAAVSFCETTQVLFTALSAEEIRAYIRTREPMDKSGSYGIQGEGGQFVRKVDGCYFNVMGFPMHAFSRRLAEVIRDGKA